MNRYEKEQQFKEMYRDCMLCYNIKEEKFFSEMNQKNLQKMQEALHAVGFSLQINDGQLTLSIFSERYNRISNRYAGRRKGYAYKESADGIPEEVYQYSDIVYLMQTMKDQEVADEIGMKIATYYRHKKAMKESSYYKSLDLDRARDKEYLESVPGNHRF